ncbi:MAG: 1-deoxy-D-xylulose-5-phosphate reductoisomerase [Chthonomonadaceae bacterium]|nr:1-deoxy-D-xylulose-5-phosphate reductoisomerase [Chthonomonadaceae bacterium]
MKRIAVLGSTGSIGTQTLDVVKRLQNQFDVVGLCANRNRTLLEQQGAETQCTSLVVLDESVGGGPVRSGMNAAVDLVTSPEVDLVVVALAGVVALEPTIAAIRAGKSIALASKEVLVAAGEPVMNLVRELGTAMTPIDSEHSAVFQCLQGGRRPAKVILTASGGPFRGKKREQLAAIGPKEALNHPTWTMGGKITIDSATLMNKGLEIIEAKWLFGLDLEQVDFVVHPQSIVHSFIEFEDTSVLAQCGWPDMRLPIQYALTYPERVASGLNSWNPVESSNLTFEAPDLDTFISPVLARSALRSGGTMPAVLNAANEEVVKWFLSERCGFLQMADVIGQVMSLHIPEDPSLEAIVSADQWARETVRRSLKLE